MERPEFERRERAWEAFHAWEASVPTPEWSIDQLLVWLQRSLSIARSRGDLIEESPEDKAKRLARLREALAMVRIPA